MTLVLLGQVLELKARSKTGAAIKMLLGLAPKTARRVKDGKEEDIPIEHVNKEMTSSGCVPVRRYLWTA